MVFKMVVNVSMLPRIFVTKRLLCSSVTSVHHEVVNCPAINTEEKILKIAIVGSPNAGKSTLINSLVGRRVCSESQKVHTTRYNVKAIAVHNRTQLIYLDTPGVVSRTEVKKHKLETSFVSDPAKAVLNADIIGFVHDVSNKWFMTTLDWKVLQLLQEHKSKKSILILNKIDILNKKHQLLQVVKTLTNNSLAPDGSPENLSESGSMDIPVPNKHKKLKSWSHFSEVFMVSALTNDGVCHIKEYFLQQAKPGPWIFKRNEFTDLSPEKIIMEAVQSRLLEHLPQEVPYSISTRMEYFEEKPDGRSVAVVLLVCPTVRLQRLVVGRNGQRIKLIAREAEQLVTNTFLDEFYLKLAVTCKERSD